MRQPTVQKTRKARWSRRFASLAVPVVVLATLLHRFDAIDTNTLIASFGLAALIGLLALALAIGALVAMWRRGVGGMGDALFGLFVSLAILGMPGYAALRALDLPAIHDVTTDTVNPPPFRLAAEARPAGSNTPVYDAADAALQRAAYPTIVPLRVNLDPAIVFQFAARLVDERGWQVLDSVAPASGLPGRIEAVARTLLLGFRDDVVIVVAAEGDHTRLDMRSASRFGEHDLGANAERVRAFLNELSGRLVHVRVGE